MSTQFTINKYPLSKNWIWNAIGYFQLRAASSQQQKSSLPVKTTEGYVVNDYVIVEPVIRIFDGDFVNTET